MNELYSEHPAMFRNHPIGFIVSLLLVPVGIGLLIFLVWRLQTRGTKLSITENEIMYEKGLLSKERSAVTLGSVRTVRVTQSFSDRIFGVGAVQIFTAGDNPEIVAAGMPDPNRISEIIKARQNDGE